MTSLTHRTRKILALVICVFSAAVIFAIYAPALKFPYYFDDLQAFGGDLERVDLPSLPSVFSPLSRPLLQLWFYWLSQLGDNSLYVYRLAGIAIHCWNAFLVFFLADHLLNRVTRDSDHSRSLVVGGREVAAWLAVIWLFHPVAVQTVCSVVQQAESLMTTCIITALLLIAKSTPRRLWLRAIGFNSLLIAGLYLKVVMVVVIPAGLLLDAICFRGSVWKTFRHHCLIHLPPWALGVVLVAIVSPALLRAEGGVGFGGDAPPVPVYFMTSLRSLVEYFGLAFFPNSLAIDRAPNWIVSPVDAFPWFVVVAVYIGTAVWVWVRSSRVGDPRTRLVAWLMLMPLIVLLPTSSIIPTADSFFEHRIYFAMVFVLWLSLLIVNRVIHSVLPSRLHRQMAFAMVGLSMTVGFAARTQSRVNDFNTLESIWRSALLVDPSNARAAQNWVAAMQEADQESLILPAIKRLMIAAGRRQQRPDALAHQFAKELLRRGESTVATEILENLTSRLPEPNDLLTNRARREFGEIWFDLALGYSQLGRPDQALAALQKTQLAAPADPVVFQFQGDLYQQLGDEARSKRAWGEAARLWENVTIP